MWLLKYSWEGWQLLVNQGGILIYVLLLVSVFGLAIVLEKLIVLRRRKVFDESSAVDLLLELKRAGDGLAAAKRNAPGPMADIVSSAQLVEDLPKEDMMSEMASVASLHVRRLGKRVRMLGTLAQISPLVGLLGTVVGMIRAMGEISVGAGADPISVSQGISQALITTAVGLTIGIPFLVVHSYFRNKVNYYASELEEFSHEVMKAFHYPDSVVIEKKTGSDFDADGPGDSDAVGEAGKVDAQSPGETSQ